MPRDGNFEAMIGSTYGLLTVKSISSLREYNKTYVYCTCACGKSVKVQAGSVKSGKSTSCGCKRVRKPFSLLWGG